MWFASCVVLGLASVALAACGKAPEPPAKLAPPSEPEYGYQEMPATRGYPLKTCVVDGADLTTLGHKPYVFAYKAYEVQVCSKHDLAEFSKDPEGYVRKINPKAMFDK